MSNGIKLEGFEEHLVDSLDQTDADERPNGVFRVAVLGDWSGRANRSLSASSEELANWRPREIDSDNLDDVMAKLGVSLKLRHQGHGSMDLTFERLDDFHPDFIFERSELFQHLRDLRNRLRNRETFAAAAREMRVPTPAHQPTPSLESPPAQEETTSGSLLDHILAGGDDSGTGPTRRPVSTVPDLQSLVQDLVRPHLLPDDSEQEALIATVDKTITDQMRSVLHTEDFQSLEGAWRALHFLLRRLETGTELKLYLLDISRQELDQSLAGENISESGPYKLLVKSAAKTIGGEPWSLIVANYSFDYTAHDANILEKLARLTAEAGCAFVAGAMPAVVGTESFADTIDAKALRLVADPKTTEGWSRLQSLRQADHIGLTLPRFLLRLPYGSGTEPIDSFDFEESGPGALQHEHYLWGNAAFGVCYLICTSFCGEGWDFEPGTVQDIEGLPLHVYEAEGETRIKPCAETLMTTEFAKSIIERGIMPLITMKGTDTVRLGSMQSIALPRRALEGSWS